MALIRHSFLPRSMFDMDSWFRPTLDTFDPFDELDHISGRNLEWLSAPSMLQFKESKITRKYRISLDCAGYNPKSIKTEVKDGKLCVIGKEEVKDEKGDYSCKEFRKTYDLPENTETDKLVSFVTRQGNIVIEMPLKVGEEKPASNEDDMFPKIIESKDGDKQIKMKCNLPKNVDPSKLTVTCKDRDVIIKAEDIQENDDKYSRRCYYKRFTMPERADLTAMKCSFENNLLTLEAPFNAEPEKAHSIPIEIKNN